jgi:hypothetical protein
MTDTIPEKPFWGLTPAADEADYRNKIVSLEKQVFHFRSALEEIASGRLNGLILASYPPKHAAQHCAQKALESKIQ